MPTKNNRSNEVDHNPAPVATETTSSLESTIEATRAALHQSGLNSSDVATILECELPADEKRSLFEQVVANAPCGIFTDAAGKPSALDLGHIDKGGMAAVRMGWHIHQQRRVAIKVSFVLSDDAPMRAPIQPNAAAQSKTTFPSSPDRDTQTLDQTIDHGQEPNAPPQDDQTAPRYEPDLEATGDFTAGDQQTGSFQSDFNDHQPTRTLGVDASQLEFELNQTQASPQRSTATASRLATDLQSFTRGRPPIGIDVRFEREIAAYEQMPDMGFVDKGWFGQHKALMMEYLDGAISLKHILDNSSEPLSPQVVSTMAVLLCKLLSKIHRHRIGHRDIKPGNILIDREGHLRIIDFGLAKNYGVDLDANNRRKAIAHMAAGARSSYEATEDAGGMVGTPIYMPPEQFATAINDDARDIFHAVLRLRRDERQDIYSLGATLFNLANCDQLMDPLRFERLLESEFNGAEESDRLNLPQHLKILSLLTNPTTFESSEFETALAQIGSESLRDSITGMTKFDPDERKALKTVAKRLFSLTPVVRAFKGDFEAFWADESNPVLSGYSSLPPNQKTAAPINRVHAERCISSWEKRVVHPGHSALRYTAQNRVLVGSILGFTLLVATAGVWMADRINRNSLRQTARSSVNVAIATSLQDAKPTADVLEQIQQAYNSAVLAYSSQSSEFKEQLHRANDDNAYVFTFDGDTLTDVQLALDVQTNALLTELDAQIEQLDGTAQALDKLDLTKVNESYAAIIADRYEEFRQPIPQLAGHEHEVRANGVVSIVHKQEELDAMRLANAYQELIELLAVEDGPHTQRSQAKLKAINFAIENWSHRTSVLNTIEDAGVDALPDFVDHEYSEDTAELKLANKVEQLDSVDVLFKTRFGNFQMRSGVVIAIDPVNLEEDDSTLRLYESEESSEYERFSYFEVDQKVMKNLVQSINKDLTNANVKTIDYFSIGSKSGSILATNKVQGFLQFDLDNKSVTCFANIDDVKTKCPKIFEELYSTPFVDFKTESADVILNGHNINDVANNEIVKFIYYLSQYPIYKDFYKLGNKDKFYPYNLHILGETLNDDAEL